MIHSLLTRLSLRYPWVAAPFLMLGGCNLFAETVTPLPVQVFGDPQQADHVVVLLPGIRDRGEVFIDEGFVEDARAHINSGRIALLLVDAHVGYYRERSVTERLKADVLDAWPDRKLIMAGISLGGFGALTVARRHPDRIESLLLLAPFLGEKSFLKRLQDGLPQTRHDDEEIHHELVPVWHFLLGDTHPPIMLAYGQDDDFAPHYAALQQLGADISTTRIDGDHDWGTWRRLWRAWLKGL